MLPYQQLSAVALTIASLLPLTTAHGFISSIFVNGKHYPGAIPSWHLLGKNDSAVWFSDNYGQHNPIFSAEFPTPALACHRNATPGNLVVPVKAGDTLELTWSTPEWGPWRTSHEGPVIDYLASCGGDCREAKADELKFFKIKQEGMFVSPSKEPGKPGSTGQWGTDILRNDSNVWHLTIPSGLAGGYVLREEPIALMGAGHLGHGQFFPQCVSLDIQNDGNRVDPCASGAECVLGQDLYKETDPGIYISIHNAIANYTVPGPALWKGVDEGRVKPAGHAGSGTSPASRTTVELMSLCLPLAVLFFAVRSYAV